MGRGGCASIRPFKRELERWRFVGGGIDADGEIIQEPWELTKAKLIDTLCQRYGCLPSELLNESVSLIQMHSILALAGEMDQKIDETNNMESSLANMSKGL